VNARRWIGLLGGLGLVALLILLPAPRHPAAAPVGPVASSPSASAGPTLTSTWPKASVFDLPASFPDGSAYQPELIVDAHTSLGLATTADGLHVSLVVAESATGSPRVLDSAAVSDGGSFDGLTVTADRYYWMRTVNDAEGHARVSLWTAERSGGRPHEVTADAGAALFDGSSYDVQVVGGRLYWLAGTDSLDRTELRSVPLAGGKVEVRALPGAWTMTAWPWVVTAPGSTGAAVELLNLQTNARVPVHAPADRSVLCSPVWCRLIADNADQSTGTDLIHPDGGDPRHIGDRNAIAMASDVALLDRFEPLMTALTSTNNITVSRLELYDAAARRTVLVEAAATSATGKGDYLWWSTGDNETLAWHAVDLRTLN
jgi:hypothetical protein